MTWALRMLIWALGLISSIQSVYTRCRSSAFRVYRIYTDVYNSSFDSGDLYLAFLSLEQHEADPKMLNLTQACVFLDPRPSSWMLNGSAVYVSRWVDCRPFYVCQS